MANSGQFATARRAASFARPGPRRGSPGPAQSRRHRRGRARARSSGRGPGTARGRPGSSSRTPPGRSRSPCTWPPAHVIVARPGQTGMTGIRAIHSSRATRSSIRARFDPAQRWMPEPNATCRLWARSGLHLVGAARMPRGRGSRREVDQHLVPAFASGTT